MTCFIVYYIQELLLDNEMIIEAKHLIEECIESIVNLISLSLSIISLSLSLSCVEHNTSEPLDMKTIQQFHVLLWSQAAKTFEVSEREREYI